MIVLDTSIWVKEPAASDVVHAINCVLQCIKFTLTHNVNISCAILESMTHIINAHLIGILSKEM